MNALMSPDTSAVSVAAAAPYLSSPLIDEQLFDAAPDPVSADDYSPHVSPHRDLFPLLPPSLLPLDVDLETDAAVAAAARASDEKAEWRAQFDHVARWTLNWIRTDEERAAAVVVASAAAVAGSKLQVVEGMLALVRRIVMGLPDDNASRQQLAALIGGEDVTAAAAAAAARSSRRSSATLEDRTAAAADEIVRCLPGCWPRQLQQQQPDDGNGLRSTVESRHYSSFSSAAEVLAFEQSVAARLVAHDVARMRLWHDYGVALAGAAHVLASSDDDSALRALLPLTRPSTRLACLQWYALAEAYPRIVLMCRLPAQWSLSLPAAIGEALDRLGSDPLQQLGVRRNSTFSAQWQAVLELVMQ